MFNSFLYPSCNPRIWPCAMIQRHSVLFVWIASKRHATRGSTGQHAAWVGEQSSALSALFCNSGACSSTYDYTQLSPPQNLWAMHSSGRVGLYGPEAAPTSLETVNTHLPRYPGCFGDDKLAFYARKMFAKMNSVESDVCAEHRSPLSCALSLSLSSLPLPSSLRSLLPYPSLNKECVSRCSSERDG
jgi:hypothetical protein